MLALAENGKSDPSGKGIDHQTLLGKRIRSLNKKGNGKLSSAAYKSFECHLPSCGKIFSDRASLKKHMTVHGDKLFQCTYGGCEKRFLDNAKLKRHMLVHTGEKPYQCD